MTSASGAGLLLRFHLKRDRLLLLWWIAGNVMLYVSQAVGTDGLYSTQGELDKAAAGMESNAAFIAMAGPARALNTVGGQVAWQAAAFGAIVAGLMSMFLVGRHTRAEEESGRDELIRAGRVGRHAPLVAAAAECAVANLVMGVSIAGGLIAYGLPSPGSIALGLAAGEAGLFFGAVTLVGVQISQSTRGAYAITGAVMAAAYALRAVGDVGNGAVSWASPIGWGQYLRAYAGEQWWPATLSIAAVAALGVLAVRLFDLRDMGSGMWSAKPGPSRGRLSTSLGLAWRLHRGSVAGWAVGTLLSGIAYGSIGDDVKDLFGESSFAKETFEQASGGSFVDSFYAVFAMMIALIATGFTISSVLRLRSEESQHFAELLLATAEPRWRWAASHLTIAAIGTVVVVAAGGLGMGIGYAAVTGDSSAVMRLLGATLPYIVPVLVIGGGAWLAYALHPAAGMVGWALLVFCLVVMMFGPVLRLPAWLVRMSPFEHLALVPAEQFRIAPVAALAGLVAMLAAGGFLAVSRRDMR